MTEKAIIAVYPNGDYVGVDSNSGGYPYPTKEIRIAHWWPSMKRAQDYTASFQTSMYGGPLTAKVFNVTITEE